MNPFGASEGLGEESADRSGLKVLFMTGYAEEAWDRNAFVGNQTAMITKPFALDALARRIQEILG